MIAGYCWPQSALPEETVKIFCHTEADTFKFTVLRQGKSLEKITESKALEGITQTISPDTSVEGCDWVPSFELVIDPNWKSGFYFVQLEDSNGAISEAFFVVRARERKHALFVLATSTWNAYNTWGGLSYYTGGYVTSLKRPLPSGFLSKKEPERHRIARHKSGPRVQVMLARSYRTKNNRCLLNLDEIKWYSHGITQACEEGSPN